MIIHLIYIDDKLLKRLVYRPVSLLVLLLLLFPFTGQSQEQNYYQFHLREGMAFYDQKDFASALNQFELAKKYIPANDENKRDRQIIS